jgi:hypothetical protein
MIGEVDSWLRWRKTWPICGSEFPARSRALASLCRGGAHPAEAVRFQNSATVSDQRFQAAGSYSLMSPPRTGRRRILPRAGWGTGDPGRGGRSWRARCGRCVL